MGTLWQDVRYGFRMLAHSPGFTGIVLLVVGLGIGVNTALFNALDQVCLRPLPVERPGELVSVQFHVRRPNRGEESTHGIISYPTYETYRDQAQMPAGLAAFTGEQKALSLRIDDVTMLVASQGVSVNYFSVLGIRPAVGRMFTPEQEQDSAFNPVAVISDRLWRRQFGGKGDVIGKPVILRDRVLTVIGVAPPGFTGMIAGQPVDVYLTLGASAQIFYDTEVQKRDFTWLFMMSRLPPGPGRERARAALQVVAARMDQAEAETCRTDVLLTGGRQGPIERAGPAFYPLALFLAAAVLVLLIACANIANLQLARAATRQKEIAVRQALGAGRRRVLRQLLVENLLLALAGGVCGILFAVWLDRAVCTVLATIASVRLDPQLHPRVLLYALAISLATGVAFGLAPALQLVRRSIVPCLKDSAPGADLPVRWNSHSLLVVGQIAVAAVVMVFSGLCLRSLIGLRHIDQGYDPAHVLVARLDLEGWLSDRPDLRRFVEDLQERVKRLPGVLSTSLAALAPLDGRGYMQGVARIEGVETPSTGFGSMNQGVVGPGHFQTLGQRLLAGRDFTSHDGPEAPKVMIVNEVLAQRYWPNQDPIGKRIWFREETGPCEVVGLVKAAKVRYLLEESRPVAYLPLAQNEHKPTPVLLVRTTGRPQSLVPVLRKEAAAGAPAGMDIRTVAEQISGLLLPQQIITEILNLFGFVGLLLSATGIYAVVAYAVRRRTREIGIRIALGARGQDVLVPVLRQGVLLLTMGLGLGLGLSLAGTRILASRLPQIRAWNEYLLYGIQTWDPATYAGATLLIAVVALLACYLPARRAARIDPMAALRYE